MAQEARRLFIRMGKIRVRTSIAFIIWAVLLSSAFIVTAKYPDAKFDVYAMWLTLGLTAYTGKRLFQKHPKLNSDEK